ncbi:integrase_H2C2 domain-containing protein [Trichonephila clavipes]|nr:integrase_H2C2 domain-containing protein [Trichonephila clavipes]
MTIFTAKTSFITAKSRVSHLKKLTLPRLELLGAVLASRILKYLTSKFKFRTLKFFLWSDSSIALHWIKGKASNYKQFVSNRVIEIQSNSDPSDWNHCSGRENAADYVSRGENLEMIINSQFWMHGPQWLCTTENNWPKNLNCDFSSTDPCESEEQVFTFACELNTASIINLSKFSSLQKLLRVTSCVLRFVHNIRNRFNKRSDDLSTEEIDGAENFWIQLVQRDAFAEEVNCLRARKLLLKTSVILEFNPFLDLDELIRVGGRLQKSKFSYLQKHPIILPAKHYFVNLMVLDSHEKVLTVVYGSLVSGLYLHMLSPLLLGVRNIDTADTAVATPLCTREKIAVDFLGRIWKSFLETGSAGRGPGQGRRRATTPNEDRYLC